MAFICDSTAVHYGSFCKLIDCFVHRLISSGVRPGQNIGLAARHPLNHMLASLALYKMGANQIVLSSQGPLQQSVDEANVASIITDQKLPPADVRLLGIDWMEMMRTGMNAQPTKFAGTEASSILNLGSGTTGKRKIIRLSGKEFEQQVEREQLARPISPGDRFLSIPPPDFLIAKRAIYACLAAGGTTIFIKRDVVVEDVCDLYAVDHLLMVVIQATRLLASVTSRNADPSPRLPKLKTLTVRSSPVSERLRSGLRKLITPNAWIAYGTNEFGTATVARPEDQQGKPGSIGRVLDGVRLEVVDDDDKPLPANKVGHIRMKASGMFQGYVGFEEETAAALKDGWFYPKDLGSMSEDGVVTFHGRSDDMIIFEGSNIAPREIEQALEQHAAVEEVAAFALPTDSMGDIPVAAVTLNQAVSGEQLFNHCYTLLGENAPRRIIPLDEFPHNPAGKILKQQIKESVLKLISNEPH